MPPEVGIFVTLIQLAPSIEISTSVMESPDSGSMLNVMLLTSLTTEPEAGEVIVTVGAAVAPTLLTVTERIRVV